jgi:hypothetical protein
MVVDIWAASAVSATRMRRNICGPWLDEGPKEDDRIGVVPNMALAGPEGSTKPPIGPDSCFFNAAITLEGRRCILLSNCSFCCTEDHQL